MTTSPLSPRAAGVPRRRAGGRAAGFGLIAVGFAPLVVVVGGVILLGFLMVQTVSIVTSKVAAVAAIASRDIQPEIAGLQTAYGRLAGDASDLKGRLDDALGTLAKLQDLKIESGQLGHAGGQRLTIPDRNVSVGPVTLDQGKLFDKDLPSVPIPPGPVALPMAPLRAAFGPLGPDGPLAAAIGKAQGELGSALGEVEKLKQPLLDVSNVLLTIPAPLRGTLERLALIVGVGGTVLGTAVLAWFIVAASFIRRRWRLEGSVAYRAGGIPGLLMYGQRSMLGEGFSRALGRVPPLTPEAELAELRAEITQLRALARSRHGSELTSAE